HHAAVGCPRKSWCGGLAPIAHVESICRLFASVSHKLGAIPFEAGRMWKPEYLDGNRVVDGSDGAEVRLDGSPERFWWFISGRKLVLPTAFNERHVNRGSRIWAAATPDRGTSAVVRPTAAMCAKSR